MNGKRVAIAGGLIAVAFVCIAMALVLYPISPADIESRFSPAEAAGHETSGSILIDGETYVDYEGTVTPDGTGFFEARSDDGYVRQLYEEDGVVYARLVTTDTDRVDSHSRTFGSEIVSQEETDGHTTTILRADEPKRGVETPIENWNEVVVDNLQLTTYERTDDPRSYEPQSGWFHTSRDYRITDASGELDADPESGTVIRADVTFRRTVAGSYFEYVANRDDGVRTEVTYEQRSNSVEVETPDWVAGARS